MADMVGVFRVGTRLTQATGGVLNAMLVALFRWGAPGGPEKLSILTEVTWRVSGFVCRAFFGKWAKKFGGLTR
jgi:hypothetical protein